MTHFDPYAATEDRQRAEALARCPKAEALVGDLWGLLDRWDVNADQKKRLTLEMILHGVTGLIEMGFRDIRPDEEEALRRRMEEVVNADHRP